MICSSLSRTIIGRRAFLRAGAGLLASAGAVLNCRPALAETQLASRIAEIPEAHPLFSGIRLASKGLDLLAGVADYQATLVRQEQIGRKLVSSRMELKFREEPFSVYLKFIEPKAGREVIYVDGLNDSQLQVHETGLASLVGTLSLDPQGKLAMDGARHPITMIGLRKMTQSVIEQWITLTGTKDVKANFYPEAHVGDLSCQTVESILPKPVDDIEQKITRLYFDAATGLPVRAQSFAFPEKPSDKPPLLEDFYYLNLKTNVALADIDFDVKNPKYGF